VIGEAVDTALTLGWALAVWIVLLAAVGTLAGWTVVVTVAWACRALWRACTAAWQGTTGPAWARSRLRARLYARTKRDYREAA
jgi:hypothetical protein